MYVQKTLGFGLSIVAVFAAMLCAGTRALGAPQAILKLGDASHHPFMASVDRKILIEMFHARLYLAGDGSPERMNVVPGSPSMYGISEEHPLYEYFIRWRQLYDAHLDLLKTDSSYAERFREIEARLVQELGYYASQRDGRTRANSMLVSAGLLTRIIRHAPESAITAIPADASNDPWGSSSRPYAHGISVEDLVVVRDSVMPFHYCDGMRDQNGHGITISGGDENPFVNAHQYLLRSNESYRELFQRTMAPFMARGRELDVMDFPGASGLTREMRDALVASGIADAIEEVVNDVHPGLPDQRK